MQRLALCVYSICLICVLLSVGDGAELFGGAADAEMATFEVEVDLDAASKLKMSRYRADRSVSRDADAEVIDLDAVDERGRWRELEAEDDAAVRPGKTVMRVGPRGFNYGRGVGYAALAAVPTGSPLFSVDLGDVMSLSSAARGRIQVLLDVNPDLPPTISLALHLLEERFLGARSNFSAFIDRLPSAVNSTTFYSAHDLDALRGSQLLRHALARKEALESFYDALLGPATSSAVDPPLFSRDEFSREHFRWAMGIIWSHSVQIGQREADLVLAPVLDTIGICLDEREYACPATNVVVDSEAGQLVVYATMDYQAGQEVRMSPGDKSSLLLMLNHGVSRAQPSPTLDKLDVSIFLDSADPLLEVKQFLHESMLNRSINDTYALQFGASELRTDMAVSLKLKLMTGAETPRRMDLLSPPGDSGKRILSLRNEFAFTRAVVTTCRNLLAEYAAPLAEDERQLAALGDAAAQTRAGQVLRALALEKRALQHTVDLAMRAWSELVLTDHPNLVDAAS